MKLFCSIDLSFVFIIIVVLVVVVVVVVVAVAVVVVVVVVVGLNFSDISPKHNLFAPIEISKCSIGWKL